MNLCPLPTDPGSSKVGFAINKSHQITSLMFHHSENRTSSSPQISTWLWWCKLPGDMLVPKRVIQLPSSIHSYLGGSWYFNGTNHNHFLKFSWPSVSGSAYPDLFRQSSNPCYSKSGLDCDWMIIRNSPHYGKVSTTSSKQHAKGLLKAIILHELIGVAIAVNL